MRCPNCGRQADPADDSCGFCGASLGQASQGTSQSQRGNPEARQSRQGTQAAGGEQRARQGNSGRQQRSTPRADQPRSQPASSGGQSRSGAQAGARSAPQGGGDEPITDAIFRPGPQSYIKGIVAMMATLGVFLSAGVVLVANLGGPSLVPGLVQELSGVTDPETGISVGNVVSFIHELGLAYYANEIAIFLAFMMAPIIALLVIFQMNDTTKAKVGSAAIGVGIGTIVFMVIVVATASMVVPSLSDLDPQLEEELAEEDIEGFGEQTLDTVDLGSVDFSNLLINSLLIGLVTAGASGSIVYYSERFFT